MPDISFVIIISPEYAISVIGLVCPALIPCFAKRDVIALSQRMAVFRLDSLSVSFRSCWPSSGVRAWEGCNHDAKWVPAPLVRRPGKPMPDICLGFEKGFGDFSWRK